MNLGFMALNERTGDVLKLTKPKHPRKQLLEKLAVASASKMYADGANGAARHIGYVAGGGWWRILEVHDWKGGRA